MCTKEPPEHLQIECSICLCVLSDPRLIGCNCGACFCQTCIEPTLTGKKLCPLCNSPFTTSCPDRRLQRTIRNLQVYCSFKEAGCEWVGELGTLSQHLNVNSSDDYKRLECPFFLLECCYCKEMFQRQFVLDHEQKECLKRPFSCDYCNEYESTFEDVTTKHTSVCPSRIVPCPNECGESLQHRSIDDHLASNCPLETVNCSFSYAGCEEKLPRKDMPSHISESLAVHMSLQAVNHQRQLEKLETQIQKLEKEVKTLTSEGIESVYAHLRIMPVNVVMGGFAAKRKEGRRWESQPFYTHPRGYKMFLCVFANGDQNEGTYISVFLYLMCGEFDNQLEWPFRGSITVQLLDQEGANNHHERLLNFHDAPEKCTHQVTEGKTNGGWGLPDFISIKQLRPKYLKKDRVSFNISYSFDCSY